jgi:hypothetical protein
VPRVTLLTFLQTKPVLYSGNNRRTDGNGFSRNFVRVDFNRKTNCGHIIDRLCGLVVRVLGYRSGGPGSISGTKKKVVGLEWGALSLVSATEELLDRKVSGSCLENREYGRRDPSH